MYMLLIYEVVDDYVERRAQFRDHHLKLARESAARGELLLGGALADPVDRAYLLFKGDDVSIAKRFAEVDPYVTNGLVKKWEAREWKVVAGSFAQSPL